MYNISFCIIFKTNRFSLLTLVGAGDVLPKPHLPGQCTLAPAAGSAGCSPLAPCLENCSRPEGSHEPGGPMSLIPGHLEANGK